MRIGCIWMASGEGKRFGANKLMADLAGQPVIAHSIEKVPQELFVRRLVVTRWQEVAQLCEQKKIPALLHDRVDRNEVVRLGLQRMQDLDGCLFFQADQPLCTPQSIQKLVQNFCSQPSEIHRLAWQDAGASPVIFPACLFGQLLQLPPKKGGGYVIEQNPQKVRLTQADHPWELWDIDTPEALQRICRQIAQWHEPTGVFQG